jgi:hypothetical protein
MRILFITPNCEDYLADGLLHGFKTLFGENVLDFPRSEYMYKSDVDDKHLLYGRGFTLYRTLDERPVDRFHIKKKLYEGYFDLIVFSDIFRHFGLFVELYPYLSYKNTAIIDGNDSVRPYPFGMSYFLEKPELWFLPRAHKRFRYFKREWTPETIRFLWYKFPPLWLSKYLPTPKTFRRISFSFPAEKIVSELPKKTKLFPKHIVDPEVAKRVAGSAVTYAFADESEYYADLQASKFGITTKKAGWDCLRHYEIAANGSVPCFRNLDNKEETCAPHGLNQRNCIIYNNFDDLMDKIERLSDADYEVLQKKAWQWAQQNTTIERVKQLLSEFDLPVNSSNNKNLLPQNFKTLNPYST